MAEGGYGVWIRCGKLGMKGAFVRNSAATDAADIRIGDLPATSGADIDATNVTTTAGINKIENILGADRFNVPTKYGIVWNAAVPAPLDIGNFSSTGASRGQDWDPEFHFLRSSSNSTNTSTHIQIFNPNGEVGRLTSSANAVTLTSTSDSRQKINQVKSEFDAISWLDTIQVDEYDMLDFREPPS